MNAATFSLVELMVNPRDGSLQEFPFETFETLREAKASAKRELKGRRWAIVKNEIVAESQHE